MDIGQISTLSKFLRQSGASYRVFDMGRRVVELMPEQFISFDNCQHPYPYPFKRLAQIGIIFWHPAAAEQQYVWFLQFPVDEQGILIPDARDAFLMMLLERLGEAMLAAADGEKIQRALRDSPYTFKPRQDKMAAFNAHATLALKLEPSKYYDTAYRYFTLGFALEKWPELALQGLADFAIRLDVDEGSLGLMRTLPKLPQQPFHNLCLLLEHAAPAAEVIEVLAQQLDLQLQKKQPDTASVIACLRAASNSPARDAVERMVRQVLKHRCSKEVEILAILSGRVWLALAKQPNCELYLEQLAHNDAGQPGFNQLLADLIFIPGMREPIMQVLRNPKRSEALVKAVSEMFGQMRRC